MSVAADRPPRGRIITFYSYKGGTGRTMLLANVAWILASQGERVVVIDWDLEAPGLHRYFHPFIEDKELANTTGLIEFLAEFVQGSRRRASTSATSWFESYAHLARRATSLDWAFPGHGTIDFVASGRQGASYATSVTSFDWRRFYEDLGGGVFLEAVKRNLRAEYDYILIDSRTGVSDASGICTIQMPDQLVVCFTPNTQSIMGAAATADSAFEQRMTPNRTPSLKVWPVPTRIDLGEKERLEQARDAYRGRFQKFLHHLPGDRRRAYWGSVEVVYQPYFAYGEVLATLAERRHQTGSLLMSFEHLTSWLTGGEVTELGPIDETLRRSAVSAFTSASTAGPFLLSYDIGDEDFATQLQKALRGALGVGAVRLDDGWEDVVAHRLSGVKGLLFIVGRDDNMSEWRWQEFEQAMHQSLPIVPILRPGVTWSDVLTRDGRFQTLMQHQGFAFEGGGVDQAASTLVERESVRLATMLQRLALSGPSAHIDPDDPHRGQFGRSSTRNGCELTARIEPLSDDWFDVALRVMTDGAAQGAGEVEFHLHPTFAPAVRRVKAVDGVAELRLQAWGAFTVGAVVLDTQTQLELDLAELSAAPEMFRAR